MFPPKGESLDRASPASAASSTPPYAVQSLLTDPALRAQWQALECHAFLPSQSLAFHAALGETMLRGQRGMAITAEDSGTACAMVLLSRSARPWAVWHIPGPREIHEPTDALYRDAAAAQLLAKRLIALNQPLAIDRITQRSLLVAALKVSARGRAWISVRPASPCPTLALGPQWIEPESNFNAGRRSDLRRAARRAASLGKVSYALHSPGPDQFAALFEEAVRIEALGWKAQARTAMRDDPAKLTFFRTFLADEAAKGRLRIAFMLIDERAVAMQLATLRANRYWLFKIGYDEAFARCSPGRLLMLHTIGAAAREGLDAYELLGENEAWIADFWTRSKNPCLRLRIYPRSLWGLAALARDGLGWLRGRLR